MLAELTALHEQVLTYLAELDKITADPAPRMDAVTNARLKRTRASRRRTTFLEGRVYPALLAQLPESGRAAVEALRDVGKTRLMASISHIGQWTLSEVETRWDEYRAASRSMRASMRTRIRDEQTLLYPLLAGLNPNA